MVKNRNTTVSESQSGLPTPRFDEHASAKAQPVMPIPRSKVTILLEKGSQLFTSSSRSLVLIVALGVATGALVGMALVKERHSSVPGAEDQASVSSNVETPQVSELQDAEVGVFGLQNSRRPVIRRARIPNEGQRRAYRFAVIR